MEGNEELRAIALQHAMDACRPLGTPYDAGRYDVSAVLQVAAQYLAFLQGKLYLAPTPDREAA